jgi:hypothetical protein
MAFVLVAVVRNQKSRRPSSTPSAVSRRQLVPYRPGPPRDKLDPLLVRKGASAAGNDAFRHALSHIEFSFPESSMREIRTEYCFRVDTARPARGVPVAGRLRLTPACPRFHTYR